MNRLAFPLTFPFIAGSTLALGAAAAQPDAAQLSLAVRRLNVVGSVLYVAAHPDDENTRLLSYFANELLLRTAYLSVTRGDGGQNLIGTEQSEQLGLIRTQELLAARGVDAAEQLFTRARDFGYSKNPEETFRIWGKQEVLGDVVWAIRTFRPDVIITRFPTDGGGGHGHHTASALLAEEAFELAGDPTAFPEQLQHVQPWKPKRLVYNVARFAPGADQLLPQAFTLDVGAYNPVLGRSYGELAAESRSNHKSQGFGAPRQLGPLLEQFILVKGEKFEKSLFDGVDTRWSRVPGSEKVQVAFEQARKSYSLEAPHASVPSLLQARTALQALPESPWRSFKVAETEGVIAAALGLALDARAEEYSVAAGDSVKVTAMAVNRSPLEVKVRAIRWPGAETATPEAALATGKPFLLEKALAIPQDTPVTNPYWLEEAGTGGLYRVVDARLIGRPENPPQLPVQFDLQIAGAPLSVTRPLEYVWTDPVEGELRRTVEVTLPVVVSPDRPVLMLPGGKPRAVELRLIAGAANTQGTLRFKLPAGWRAEPASLPYRLTQKGQEQEVRVTITPPSSNAPAATLEIALEDGTPARHRIRIHHRHIPIQVWQPRAEVKLVPVQLARGGTRLGYIPGAGDLVADSLRQVGYEVTELSEHALATTSLDRFDAILIGVRAYNTHERLLQLHPRLMEYVSRGGTLVAQYSTQNRLSSVKSPMGPFPFVISRARVTDETAPMTRVDPKHLVWRKPNAISDQDFEGWVQERGLYFAGEWDPRYQAVLSTQDAGEPASQGALIIARHGKGAFIYTGLAFFRQLPAGVPGAYRLLANLLAHGKVR